MRKHDYIHPKDILPNCPECGKPIKLIRRKGMIAMRVEPRPLFYTPTVERGHGAFPVVDTKGNRRFGRISCDGLVGFVEHKCHINKHNRNYNGGQFGG